MLTLYRRFDSNLARLPEAAILLAVRIAAAQPFWASGRSKVEGWFDLRPEVIDLFREEYRLPFIAPEFAAPLTAVAEHLLPMLLVLGLFTRGSALGLFVMTMIIQLFVYPDAFWPVHSLWFALLLVLLWRGSGKLALDRWLPGARQ
jgi:putative oxidoreductase